MWLPSTLLLIVSVRLQNRRVELLAKDESTIRELQESEERTRTLIDWSPNAVAVHRNGELTARIQADLFHFHINPTCRCFSLSCCSTACGFAPNVVSIWKRNQADVALSSVAVPRPAASSLMPLR